MEYKGYLLKVNGSEVPKGLIAGFSSIPNRQQDKNSYTDNDGLTHRNILPHTKTTIKLMTGFLTLTEKSKLKSLFPAREYVAMEYWNDEKEIYSNGIFYVPDVEYEVLDYNDREIFYRPISFEFIEY